MIKLWNEESERGKRRLSRRLEIVMFFLIVASAAGYENAFETLELILIPAVGLIVALRGLDAAYSRVQSS